MVESSTSRVLITRPIEDAERTAARVAAMGFEPLVIPLRIVAKVEARLPEGRFDVIAMTSAQAIRHLPAGFTAQFGDVPVACVGDKTAAAAHEAGFRNVSEGGGTAAALAETIIALKPRSVLYICGTPRRPDLEETLTDGGIAVTALNVYLAKAAALDSAQQVLLMSGTWEIALLYSPESAATLAAHLSSWPAERLAEKRFLCLSAAVAERLPAGAIGQVATEPNEAGLLAMLGQAN